MSKLNSAANNQLDYEIVIVGSGFAGLGLAARLKREGFDSFAILEKKQSIGGVWRDNTYPGCTSDAISPYYSFSFQRNCDWSAMYAPQSEILEYANQLAEKIIYMNT